MELFGLINQRLSYMEDVALYKGQHNIPIEDKEREAIVIANAAQSATLRGVEVKSAERFFTEQISAAKFVQQQVLRAYSKEEVELADPMDLDTQIRPALTTLGDAILLKISDYLTRYGPITVEYQNLFYQQINNKYLQQDQKHSLFHALSQLREDRPR